MFVYFCRIDNAISIIQKLIQSKPQVTLEEDEIKQEVVGK